MITVLLPACAATQTTDFPVNYETYATNRPAQVELRRECIDYLREMARDEYALYRANAIEALQQVPELGEPAAREGLLDENLGVRFAAAMAIGQKRHSAAAPLAHALLTDPSDSVRAAAIFALKRNGREVDVSPLATMLRSPDPRTAGNAALVIGELGDPTAISMLRDAIEYSSPWAMPAQERVVQLQIAEALAKLGDPTAISRIRSQLYSRRPDEGEHIALAASMLGRLGATRTRQDLRNIVAAWRQYRASAEVRLAALAALAQLDDPQPVEFVLEYLGPAWRDANNPAHRAIRAQAAFALGEYRTPEVLPHLAHVFDTAIAPEVRIQAAAAVLRIVAAEE